MKKYLLSLVVIIAFAFYAIFNNKDDGSLVTNTNAPGTGQSTSTVPIETIGQNPGSGISTSGDTENDDGTTVTPTTTITAEVVTLQRMLIAQGYLHIAAPTGHFGPLTEKALVAYQAANPATLASGTTSATSTPGSTTTSQGQYKDGTYTGTAANAFYGTIQVAAVVSGGALTDVQFLQYPNEPGHSTQVSNEALPRLKQEAIAAQNANVDIVSGATQDSQAFQQSLASALALAKN